MKKISLAAVFLLFLAPAVFAGVVEDWTNISTGNTGTFADSNGSKIDFETEANPKGGQAMKLTSTLTQGGYCGIWHNISGDMSKNGSLRFWVKSSVEGDVQVALKDTFNVQYTAMFKVTKDWTQVTVPFSSFAKDATYTPPNAVPGHPMDLSNATGMNFSPKMAGASVVEIGKVEAVGAPQAAPAPKPEAKGPTIIVSDFVGLDSTAAAPFQDDKGSKLSFTVKENPNHKGKSYITLNYELVQGGYCGMWCRAGGTDWSGVNLTTAQNINLLVFSKDPVVVGLALKDKNNNQYIAEAPPTQGGKWEAVQVPLESFQLDPYYTPPDAVKGAPKDFSKIKTFNIQPKTVGKVTFALDVITAK